MPISTAVTSMKDEAPYIIEWVAYHRALGFDRLVVLANDCTDGTHEMLTRLHEMGAISYYENVVPFGAKPHSRALKIANATTEVQSADFVMVLDADEFLVIKDAPHSLSVLLDKMQDTSADMMVIPWRMFGSSHQMEFQDRPVIERFTQSMDASDLPKVGVKTLFRQRDNVRLAIHFPKFIMKGGEIVDKRDTLWIDAGCQPLVPSELTWNGGRQTIHRDHAEVAHFMIKSLDEYLLKIFRGDGLMNSNRHGIDYWCSADHNEVSDLVVADNVSGFTEERDRLFADPVLLDLHCRAVANRFEKLKRILANPDVQKLRTILKKSTAGNLEPEDIKTSRALVIGMSPAPVQADKLIEGEIPHSTLVSITDTGLADAEKISWRLFKGARQYGAMYWSEKKFGRRPITSLVEGLKRAQAKGREAALGVRWFNNYTRAAVAENWPLDDEILVVLTRDGDSLISGFPAHVAGSNAKYIEKSHRGFPPLRQVLSGTESAARVRELIAQDKVQDPRVRQTAYLDANPEAVVLNLDHPDQVNARLAELKMRGPSGTVVVQLLRDALHILDPADLGDGKDQKNKAHTRAEDAAPAERKKAAASTHRSEAAVSAAQKAGETPKPRLTKSKKSVIKTFWFRRGRGAAKGNFGDELGPLIVSRLTGRRTVWADADECDLASIGSILSQVSKHATRSKRTSELLIWGSGLIEEDIARLDPHLTPLAVRGSYTRNALGLSQDIPLGDPGIVSNLFVEPVAKAHTWGIVPHFSHRNSNAIREVAARNNCLLIDPTDPPEEVLAAISSCHGIVSSSLHGLIVSDSYSVPCYWLNLKSHKSHEYKFSDYCSGVGRKMFTTLDTDALDTLTSGEPAIEGFKIADSKTERLVAALTNVL